MQSSFCQPSYPAMMATRTIEARFERMSVNDENDPGDGTKVYQKAKVWSAQKPYSHTS
jgi:aurora kinase